MVIVNWDELNDLSNPPEMLHPTISNPTVSNTPISYDLPIASNPPSPSVSSPSIEPTVSNPPVIHNYSPPSAPSVSNPSIVNKTSQTKQQVRVPCEVCGTDLNIKSIKAYMKSKKCQKRKAMDDQNIDSPLAKRRSIVSVIY